MTKLRDTAQHRIIKINMIIKDIELTAGIVDSFDKFFGKGIFKKKKTQDKYSIIIGKLKEMITELKKADPDSELNECEINPAILNRLNDYYDRMTKEENEYLKFLDSQKKTLENGVIYYDNDFYQHRVVPCRFEPFENCREIEYNSIDIVEIENDDYDCLVIDYSSDDDWDNPRSCCY